MSFVDAHTHLELLALKTVPFEKFRSVEGLVRYLKGLEEEVILAWGWDENRLDRALYRKDLEGIGKPVLLLRMDAHTGVANTALIKTLKVENPELFDEERGYLYEGLLWEAVDKLKPRGNKMKQQLLRALKRAKELGVREVHDYVDPELARLYAELDRDLPIDVVLMPYYEGYREVLSLFEAEGFRRLKFGWVKVFVDGSIGARTAYLREPYEDDGENRGKLLRGCGELAAIIRELESRGLRVSLHAIGDGAVEECLRAFGEAKPGLKYHRIEHAVLIDETQAERARELGLLLCVQPNFKPFFRKTYLKALGRERFERCVPLSLLDRVGVDMVFGSDMMPFDPGYGYRYAREILGDEKARYYYGGWREENKYSFKT
ncbi:amidohydrolase [Hydrogenivirga sp.]